MLFFVGVSQPPNLDATAHQLYTFSHGFKNFANIPLKYGSLFVVIPLYSSAFGFMFASKHQLNAMACSGMLPSILAKRVGENRIPLYALLASAALQYTIYLLGRLNEGFKFFPIIGLASCLMYMGILAAFIIFRTRFGNMHRNFVNPFGVCGAVLGIGIFLYAVLTVIWLHETYVWICISFQ
jgi:amino acid permease